MRDGRGLLRRGETQDRSDGVLSEPSSRDRDVQTTAGAVDAAQLGRILCHEHMLIATEALRVQYPHLVDSERDLERCVGAAELMRSHGVDTVCDPTCMDMGRDVRLLQHVTNRTGMRFVVCTGMYGVGFRLLSGGAAYMDVDPLADLFVHDLEVGVQGTDIRAHFLKCAADAPGVTPDVEKVHRAIARASLRTGAPIMAHSHPGTRTGLEQLRILVEEGVEPARVQVAHTGDTTDLGYIEELLAGGCFIGMDRFGWTGSPGPDQRAEVVVELIRRGHGARMTLGQDAIAASELPDELMRQLTHERHHAFLFEHTLPRLRDAGIEQHRIEPMMGANVVAWLTGVPGGAGPDQSMKAVAM